MNKKIGDERFCILMKLHASYTEDIIFLKEIGEDYTDDTMKLKKIKDEIDSYTKNFIITETYFSIKGIENQSTETLILKRDSLQKIIPIEQKRSGRSLLSSRFYLQGIQNEIIKRQNN